MGVKNVSDEKSNSKKNEDGTSGWSMLSPAKTGRSLFTSDQKCVVAISASNFSVLRVDEVEEGE